MRCPASHIERSTSPFWIEEPLVPDSEPKSIYSRLLTIYEARRLAHQASIEKHPRDATIQVPKLKKKGFPTNGIGSRQGHRMYFCSRSNALEKLKRLYPLGPSAKRC